MHGPGSEARRGFSLLEVVISVVILAILAGMVIPRITRIGKEAREVPLAQLEQLLSTLAYRDIARSGAVGLWREAGTHSVRLVTRGMGELEGDESALEWVVDPLAIPLTLPPRTELLEVMVDDEPLQPDDFLIVLNPGSPRPKLSFTLGHEGGETTVVLLPTALQPRRESASAQGEFLDLRAPIDLDAEGREQDPW